MRQFLVSLVLVMLFVLAVMYVDSTYFDDTNGTEIEPTSTPIPTMVPILDQMKSVEIEEDAYKYALVVLNNFSKLSLHPNYETKLGSERIVDQEGCKVLVSGGFYDTQNDPIGWFVSEGEELSKEETNSFLNGMLELATDSARISVVNTLEEVISGLQSGPLLVDDGETIDLSIKDDEVRRRIAVAVDRDGNLVFLVIVGEDSLVEGPLLARLPEVIDEISKIEGLEIVEALNLDGGSASAFYANGIKIRETSYIGSYFCLGN